MSDLEGAFPPDVLADLANCLESAEQELFIEEATTAVAFYKWMKGELRSIAHERGIEESSLLQMMFVGTAADFAAISSACCTYLGDDGNTDLEDDIIELGLHVGELAHDLLRQRGLDPHTGEPKNGGDST